MRQQLIFTGRPGEAIDGLVAEMKPLSVFVVTDKNVAAHVIPALSSTSAAVAGAEKIVCAPGDVSKNLDSLSDIWRQLGEKGATRSSLVINVGGGMVTDMGGFAAATFKRGVPFINVPTTLLAAVDASVGGKTGINFNGLKNEVGAFAESEASVISTSFFDTLPASELLSGYAEMLKHALLEGRKALTELLAYHVGASDNGELLSLLEASVEVKRRIVGADLHEHGLRKALNLGHTAGHAFESLAMRRSAPVPHGYAVAWGLIVELVLSHMELGFPAELLRQLASYVRSGYGVFAINCKDYPELLELMSHDKKNMSPDHIIFTLLGDAGDVRTDCCIDADRIKAALDIYCDLTGI